MQPIKVTLADYLIGGVGFATFLLFHHFREPLAHAFGMTPKLVSALGAVIGSFGAAGLSLLKAGGSPSHNPTLRQRLLALFVLIVGLVYYLYREELAGALHIAPRLSDAVMLVVGIAVILRLVANIEPASNAHKGRDNSP